MCSPDIMRKSQVLLDGRQVAHLDRNVPGKVMLPPPSSKAPARLAIVVEAMGRVNFGCVPDTKGLQSPHIRLDGAQQASASISRGLICVSIGWTGCRCSKLRLAGLVG